MYTTPIEIFFTDESIGDVTSWDWDFGDGSTATEQNPSHTYTFGGTYTVTLIISDGTQKDTLTRVDLINVIALGDPIVADFSTDITEGEASLTVQFTDESTGEPTLWSWDFDNDGITDATEQNPSYTYSGAGTFSVSLTVSNETTTDTETKTDFITVDPVGINEYTSSSIELYPNPATDFVNIRITDHKASDRIEIFNTSGLMVLCEKSYSKEGIRIDLNGFIEGVYLVKISNDERINIARFIVL